MPDNRLPFLRGRISRVDDYQSPQTPRTKVPKLPSRDPKTYSGILKAQIDALVQASEARTAPRDPDAKREIIAVVPEPGSALASDPLGGQKGDVRVVSRDPDTGIVVLDAGDPRLPALTRKIDEYRNDVTEKGRPKNEPAIAPIRDIRLADLPELAGPRLRAAIAGGTLSTTDPRWFEMGCRGGVRGRPGDTEASRAQLRRQLERMKHPAPREFLATEQVFFFVRLTLSELRELVGAVDCCYEADLAGPDVRDWLIFENPPVRELQAFRLTAPPADAPAVVVLDTGVRTIHPLLKDALLSADSVLPGDASPEDEFGHGTQMCGLALHGDGLGAAVETGAADAPHWLQSVRLLRANNTGSAAEENRPWWPVLTEAAVQKAEAGDMVRPRAYALAITAPQDVDVGGMSTWSHAIDRLAFNEGRGRLLCVSAGNAEITPALLAGYPTLNLEQKLRDPAQASSALTIGAFTSKTALPPDALYRDARVIAPERGVSPNTRAGQVAAEPLKPDVVFEGGNVALSGELPDSFVPTLCSLTTHFEHLTKPLISIAQTSEATARAARLAAGVWTADRELWAESVRGLIVHAADWTDAMKQQFPQPDERLAICGYGVPDEDLALSCAREWATVIVQDEIPNAVLTTDDEGKKKASRQAKFFRLPLPEGLAEQDQHAGLRVTLSYFPEPNLHRRRQFRGLDLKWDMQGPAEPEYKFFKRINKLMREPKEKADTHGYKWTIGPQKRGRSTVQSDRWSGPASLLAGPKLIAVVPVLGWWDLRPHLKTATMRFSLIVTVRIAGVDIYTPIAQALEIAGEVEIA